VIGSREEVEEHDEEIGSRLSSKAINPKFLLKYDEQSSARMSRHFDFLLRPAASLIRALTSFRTRAAGRDFSG